MINPFVDILTANAPPGLTQQGIFHTVSTEVGAR
jgi:hypothetical protein